MSKVPKGCACTVNGCECQDVAWFTADVAPATWTCSACRGNNHPGMGDVLNRMVNVELVGGRHDGRHLLLHTARDGLPATWVINIPKEVEVTIDSLKESAEPPPPSTLREWHQFIRDNRAPDSDGLYRYHLSEE